MTDANTVSMMYAQEPLQQSHHSQQSQSSLNTQGLMTASLINPKYAQGPRALHRRTPSLSQYTTKPITKHYQLNHQILTAFESHYAYHNNNNGDNGGESSSTKLWRVAYAMGLQFIETALLEIPKHGYYYSPRHEQERMQSSIEAVRVATALQELQRLHGDEFFDDELTLEQERVQQLQHLALQEVNQASEDQLESQRQRTAQELQRQPRPPSSSDNKNNINKSSTTTTPFGVGSMSDWVVLDPLLMCQDSITAVLCPQSIENLVPPSPVAVPNNHGNALWDTDNDNGNNVNGSALAQSSPLMQEYYSTANAKAADSFDTRSTTTTTTTSAAGSSFVTEQQQQQQQQQKQQESLSSWQQQHYNYHTIGTQQQHYPSDRIEASRASEPPDAPLVDTRQEEATLPQNSKTTATTEAATTAPQWVQVEIDAHNLATAVPLVKSSTAPSQRSSLLTQAQEAVRSEKSPHTGKNNNNNDVISNNQRHVRQSSWSFVSSPTSPTTLDAQRSWGQPPPLVAQENSGIIARGGSSLVKKTHEDIEYGSNQSKNSVAPHGSRPPKPPQQQQQQRRPPIPELDDWMLVRRGSHKSIAASTDSQQDQESPLLEHHPQQHHRHSRTSTAEDIMLERALFLSGLEVVDAASFMVENPELVSTTLEKVEPPPPLQRASTSSKLDFATLSTLYHEDFDHLVRSKRIRITTAATYQGRLPESTNGCTVIAPLLCMHHLLDGNDNNDRQEPDPGVPDTGIVQVIDTETPVILGELRTGLGLSDQAFLIPADVHDYLIENGQFHQSQFVNVVGGNLLQDEHLANFVEALADKEHPKLAATLFFHEHVIAVLKLDRGDGKFWYDCIDSLPLPETLRQLDETEQDFWQRMGIRSDDPRLTQVLVPFSVRIRCLDEEALQACLRWYACSKFTEENIRYIDQYDWEDGQSDFDPRVFQAFLWGLPK